MKNKINILQKFIKESIKGYKRIFWYSFVIFNYSLLKINKIFFKKKNKNALKSPTIAILTPSKQRVHKLKRMIDSLLSNTHNIDRIHVLILLDGDERDIDEYKFYVESTKKKLNISLYVKNEKNHNIRNNYLASKIDADLYFPMNDDVIFILKDWDKYIDEIQSLLPEKPYSIWVKSDEKYDYLHCDFPIVNRMWYKKLNYIGNLYLNGFIDKWISELGQLTKQFIITKKKMLKHLNVGDSKSTEKKDQTYYDISSFHESDKVLWKKTKYIRIKDAKKLR